MFNNCIFKVFFHSSLSVYTVYYTCVDILLLQTCLYLHVHVQCGYYLLGKQFPITIVSLYYYYCVSMCTYNVKQCTYLYI